MEGKVIELPISENEKILALYQDVGGYVPLTEDYREYLNERLRISIDKLGDSADISIPLTYENWQTILSALTFFMAHPSEVPPEMNPFAIYDHISNEL